MSVCRECDIRDLSMATIVIEYAVQHGSHPLQYYLSLVSTNVIFGGIKVILSI